MQTPELIRLVVPTCCRPIVLHLAHSVPWAGHFALQKTYARISSQLVWPSMYTDVQTYCTTCPTCQKNSAVHRQDRAPLLPLPVISVPFQHMAMDIVGPLEKSSAGHRYILVISDYATRYPEAFPLRSITTPKIINALVQLFSRVGIPDEILTDQGTNFTSRLIKLLHQQLGITAMKTSPYHPQTDGLVEQFFTRRSRTCSASSSLTLEGTGSATGRWPKRTSERPQQAQKKWYDQHARTRELQPGKKGTVTASYLNKQTADEVARTLHCCSQDGTSDSKFITLTKARQHRLTILICRRSGKIHSANLKHRY